MDQKSRLGFAKLSFFPLVIGLSLFCSTTSHSSSNEGMIIDQLGTFAIGANATIEVSVKEGKIIQTYSFKDGVITTGASFEIADRLDAGWFIFPNNDHEIWSFDGDQSGWTTTFSVKPPASGKTTQFSIGETLPDNLPPAFAERIKQARVAGFSNKADEAIFITTLGRYPLGENGIVEITLEDNAIYQTVRHEFAKEEKTQSKDPKTGAVTIKTSANSSSVSSGNVISEFPDAPWFSYITKEGDVWSYDGRRTVRSTSRKAVRSPHGHISSTGSSQSVSFSKNPPKDTPQVVAERIKQIIATEKKPTETSVPDR